MSERLYIIIPVYNEEAVIEKVIGDWHGVAERAGEGSRLMVINDGSRDGTLTVLEGLKNKFSLLEVIDKTNSGHGPTCIYGYKLALEKGADFVFQTDSDDQTDAGDFWKFWEARSGNDFIFGFRPKRGDGKMRWLISRVLALVVWAVMGTWVTDSNVPFRLMKAEALRKYLSLIPEDFYLANALLPAVIQKRGGRIRWLSINFAPRRHGQDSVPLKKMFKVGIKVIRDFIGYKKSFKNG